MRVNYVIVYVSDMKRSVAFYRDVVGLSLKFETPGWTEFATEGATLALHLAKPDDPEHTAGRWQSGFSVPNIDEFHQRMQASNVPCIQEPRTVFGARIAQYADPDGLPISIGEERRA